MECLGRNGRGWFFLLGPHSIPTMTPTKQSVHTVSLNLPVIPILQMAALRFRKVRLTEPECSAAAPTTFPPS